ncbi:2-oxo-4-hydroxy-4-carboxy-5-ureidoimidazoline decarboxylase [Micromonospora mirobrigensis]|uniref:2-oxo-4-hydroxy-4-carboxy-5-ureidoimidazoline decarboxylase n=1 Tax=Micromonospora mirobrigensis TaxID=262898 RepID=A0A1C4X1P5_9ACTN|nr:2-oxo-4-hydroxy-4-carboxy-5-ureidoimidazoline decarboxylase [Micromonospora mirobrigensis]
MAEVIAGRPYVNEAELSAASDAGTSTLDETGFAEALAGHPRIGKPATGSGGQWSRREQAGVGAADEELLTSLDRANAAYEARFGHLYLVCATGRSAADLLAICRSRLANDPATERRVALTELAEINRLRLGKLLRSEA